MKLTDNDIMPLGRFKGLKMEEVPASYLIENEASFAMKLSRNAKKIYNYILENKEVLLQEIDKLEEPLEIDNLEEPLEIDKSIDFDINDL